MSKPPATTVGRPTGVVDPALPRPPSILHLLADAARLAPDRVALICGESRITYAGYLRATAGLARLLQARGAAGGRVVVMMTNSNEMAVAMQGAMAAHAQMAPINPNYTPRELEPLLRDTEASVLVCDAAAEDKARALATQVGIAHVEVFKPGALALADWIHDTSLTLPEPLPSRTEWATMPFTGGTTGVSKGAMHQHNNITSFFVQSHWLWPLEFDRHVFLNVAPMFHIWGFQMATWFPIFVRGTLVIVPKFDPQIVLESFERHAVTVFGGGPPAIYMGLMNHPRFKQTDFSKMQWCLSGGAPCPEQLLRGWEAATGCPIIEGWGMSEGAPINMNPLHGVRKLLSVGPTPPETEIDVVDLETGDKVMPVGESGEIRIRGPQFTQGYRNRAEENARAFRNGWFYTGDIGYFDADGYLFLVDRKKDMAIVGGYNVYPREIDELLFRHPKIQEAAAFGMPDERLGEVIQAVVMLKPGQSMTEDEFFAYCAENLVKYKRPTRVLFTDALPRTGANKIDKRTMKARLLGAK